jgi:nucleoside-diphosphate-sugar epimerase
MKCLITGSSGYVGSRIADYCRKHGWEVVELRRLRVGEHASSHLVPYALGDTPDDSSFHGGQALIHCAWDMTLIDWREMQATNIEGTEKLFRAAQAAGIQHLLFISSISAFEGCRSLYGVAKLETERRLLSCGVSIIRPGIIYGDHAGGMLGALRQFVQKASVIPLIAGSKKLFLCHEDDLARLIEELSTGKLPKPNAPITAAAPNPCTFRHILAVLARKAKRQPLFVPVPWQCAWLGLKTTELLGLRLGFKSDSILSLVNPNPRPDFELHKTFGFRFQPFQE